MEEATSSQVRKKRGRGPAKGLKIPTEGMFLEFDNLGHPTGLWSKKYGQHLGRCASRIDITITNWKNLEDSEKEKYWNDTKVCFLN